jgi:hypothetical protein
MSTDFLPDGWRLLTGGDAQAIMLNRDPGDQATDCVSGLLGMNRQKPV